MTIFAIVLSSASGGITPPPPSSDSISMISLCKMCTLCLYTLPETRQTRIQSRESKRPVHVISFQSDLFPPPPQNDTGQLFEKRFYYKNMHKYPEFCLVLPTLDGVAALARSTQQTSWRRRLCIRRSTSRLSFELQQLRSGAA